MAGLQVVPVPHSLPCVLLCFGSCRPSRSIGLRVFCSFLAASSENYVPIHIIWGIQAPYVDRRDFQWNYPCFDRGVPTWDSTNDISTAAAQQDVLNACQTVRDYPCGLVGCSGGYGKISFHGSVECWMEQFQLWYNQTYSTPYYPGLKTGTAFLQELKLAQNECVSLRY